jgi:hypothetical protein
MNLWPVYVNSKHRPDCPTLKLFSTDVTLVIEPQDLDAYAAVRAQRLILPGNNIGLPASRQAAFDHARLKDHEWIWILDDDVRSFGRVERGKIIKCPAEAALLAGQAMFVRNPWIAQGALEYSQYAWGNKRGYVLNSYCDCVVAINTRLAAVARFDTSLRLKGDRDFTIQLLAAGLTTVRCATHCFSIPTNGSNKGGLWNFYSEDGAERRACEMMAAKWGRAVCVPVTKPSGRNDVKIFWRRVSPRVAPLGAPA